MANFIFTRMKWHAKPISVEIWYSRPNNTELLKKDLNIGDRFNIKIGSKRYCIGSESGKGRWITCYQRRLNDEENATASYRLVHTDESYNEQSNNIVVLPDSRTYTQCFRCSSVEYFSCRMTCIGDVCVPTSDTAKELCTPANTSVYFTHVGGELKVGVSLGVQRRWVEQGSYFGAVIAEAPGLEARRLEQVAAQELDMKLQVRTKTKMQQLGKINLDEARDALAEKIEKVHDIATKILRDVDGHVVSDPEIQDLTENYGQIEFNTPIQEIEVAADAEFGGKIVGIQGSIIIAKQDVYLYAIDMKRLKGWNFEFLERDASINTQSYLDQWF